MGPVGDTHPFIAQTSRGCKLSPLTAEVPTLTRLPSPRMLWNPENCSHSSALTSWGPTNGFPQAAVLPYAGTQHPILCSTTSTRLRYDFTESLETTESREHMKTCKDMFSGPVD